MWRCGKRGDGASRLVASCARAEKRDSTLWHRSCVGTEGEKRGGTNSGKQMEKQGQMLRRGGCELMVAGRNAGRPGRE